MLYKYSDTGKFFKLEDGLSQEEADNKIKELLKDSQKDEPKTIFSGIKKFLPTFQEGDLSKEVPEAVVSGLSKAAQGLIQTGVSYLDLKYSSPIKDSETGDIKRVGISNLYKASTGSGIHSDIDNAFQSAREVAGIDPEGTIPRVTEVVTQLAVPGIAVASKVGKAAQLTNATRFQTAVSQIAAAGVVDAAVATDDITTIGDFFEGGPTQTDHEIGDDGVEETLRRLTNKLKIGVEGSAAVFASPIITKPAGLLIKGTAKGVGFAADKAAGALITPIEKTLPNGTTININPASSFIKKSASLIKETKIPYSNLKFGIVPLTDYLDDLEVRRRSTPLDLELSGKKELSRAGEYFADGISYLRYRGLLPQEVATKRSLISSEIDSELKVATNTLDSLELNLLKGLEDYKVSVQGLPRSQTTDLSLKEMYNAVEKIISNPLFSYSNRTKGSIPKNLDEVYKKHIETLPEPMKISLSKSVDDMVKLRSQIDNLSLKIADSDFLKGLSDIRPIDNVQDSVADILKKTVKHKLNSYLRRSYRIYNERNYQPNKAVMDVAIDGFKGDKKSTTKELVARAKELIGAGGDSAEVYARLGLDDSGKKLLNLEVTDDQAKLASELFLKRYKTTNTLKYPQKILGLVGTGRVPEYRLNANILKSDKKLKQYQRDLLGEVKNTRQTVLSTVADLAEFKAVDDYFKTIKDLAKADPDGIGKLFKDVNSYTAQQVIREQNERTIIGTPLGSAVKGEEDAGLALTQGAQSPQKIVDDIVNSVSRSGFGSLNGYSVNPVIYKELTRRVLSDDGILNPFLKNVYGNFLRGQAVVEYTKTILSPITQIRNVTSASLTALANGNIGRGASLSESLDITLNNVGLKKFLRGEPNVKSQATLDYLSEVQKLGVIGTQAQLKELQDIIRNGLNVTDDATKGRLFGNRVTDWVPKFLTSANQKAQDLYQAGDDIWKIYGFEFEKNKLRNALRDMNLTDRINYLTRNKQIKPSEQTEEVFEQLLKEESADIVRNTVPNYNLVPAAISRVARRLPTGNFVSFPAEILRTSANILTRSIDEMLSDNPEIAKIGLKRFTGFTTATILAPKAIEQFGYEVSGVTKEMMDAYKRSFAPPWEKNKILVGIGEDDDGRPKYINLSYSSFYDSLTSFIPAAINAGERAKKEGKNVAEQVGMSLVNGFGEFFKPFYEPKILADKILDVSPNIVGGRDGVTRTGNVVWNKADPWQDKLMKLFNHVVIDSIVPSFIPVDIRGGRAFVSPLARSIVKETELSEQLNVSETDRLRREVDLSDQLIKSFTGVTPITMRIDESVGFKGSEWQRGNRDAVDVINRIATEGTLTVDQLVNQYEKALQAKYKNDNRLHLVFKDAEKLNISENEIAKVFKDRDVTGYKSILANQFVPFFISKEKRKDMYRLGNGKIYELAYPRLEQLYTQYSKLNFSDKDVEFEPLSDIVSSIVPEAGASELDSTPMITIRPSDKDPNYVPPPINQYAVNPPSPASSAGEINPLLVPNPTTRATFGSR